VALGIGLWQLYDVNRALRESGEHEQSSVADQERMDAGHQGDEKDDRGV
ncbi:MAG: hypothetical protein GVY11_08360, partial [Gammaproteobacteria bacterium]|nr:hypothetical protein [Gammaproteobacteria bacterium]